MDLCALHSSEIGSPAAWEWVQGILASREPERLTWAECGALFRAHRAWRPARQ